MEIQLGLKENWKQFTLLVIINGFVGGMAGLERSILPQIAEKEFAIAAKIAILSFVESLNVNLPPSMKISGTAMSIFKATGFWVVSFLEGGRRSSRFIFPAQFL